MCGGIVLLQFFSWFWQWKKLEIDQLMKLQGVQSVPIFGPPCRAKRVRCDRKLTVYPDICTSLPRQHSHIPFQCKVPTVQNSGHVQPRVYRSIYRNSLELRTVSFRVTLSFRAESQYAPPVTQNQHLTAKNRFNRYVKTETKKLKSPGGLHQHNCSFQHNYAVVTAILGSMGRGHYNSHNVTTCLFANMSNKT